MTVLRLKSSLHRRPESSNLFYRKVIPEELRPFFGKREIKHSFRTADPVAARARYHYVSACIERQFASARAQLEGSVDITESHLQQLADQWCQWRSLECSGNSSAVPSVLKFLKQETGRLNTPPTFLNLDSPAQANSLDKLQKALGSDARTLLLSQGIALNHKGAKFHQLLIVLAEQALLLERPEPREPTRKDDFVSGSETPTLKDIWNRFEALYSASDNPKDRGKVATYRSDFSKLIQHAGDVRLSMLTREHALTFRDALKELPDTTIPDFEKRCGMKAKDLRKLTLNHQRTIASEENLPVRTASGVKAALKRVAAVLAFADRELQSKHNAFNPMPMVPNSQTQLRGEAFEYTKEEIERLLTSDDILRALSVDEIWCMLVLYMTGARLGEVTPMVGEDLVQIHQTEALSIREDHSRGRTVKNYSSIRKVPIHPFLKDLGFIEYATKPAKEPIFTSLWDTTGNKANRFSRKLKMLGQEQGIRSTVRPAHGFRHHVIGLWREAEKRQDLQDAYLGHANRSQQSGYSNFSNLAKTASTVWPPLPDVDKLRKYLSRQ
ncbi:DUF6538 domain-containing protein [Marinobacter sp.]|uniref:DUF6538 domain-containing protein n=1 Tax=Marinobacter sp. TaxID=50741 RepID=UPI003B5283CB